MTYTTPTALRIALEQRLLKQSNDSGISLDRLRRRVIFERVVSRLEVADPGHWVLKGGMALEVRLRDEARLTKDIDLGLRDMIDDGEALHERLVLALAADPFGDGFVITAEPVTQLMEDIAGHVTWRSRLEAFLAGRPFGRVQLDVSPRGHELEDTDFVPLPNSLAFADINVPVIEIIDVQRHAAEKLHAMAKDFGDRENTRVRDLVDIVILHEHSLLDHQQLAVATYAVWRERNNEPPPARLPPLPASWALRYEQLAAGHDLATAKFPAAITLVSRPGRPASAHDRAVRGADGEAPDPAARRRWVGSGDDCGGAPVVRGSAQG